MLKNIRFRYWFMGFGSAVIIVSQFLLDPDRHMLLGVPMASTIAIFAALPTPILAVTFAHLARRGLFDYLDLKVLANKASEHPLGAAIVFFSICYVINGLLQLFGK